MSLTPASPSNFVNNDAFQIWHNDACAKMVARLSQIVGQKDKATRHSTPPN
jgi:hypothetical protein